MTGLGLLKEGLAFLGVVLAIDMYNFLISVLKEVLVLGVVVMQCNWCFVYFPKYFTYALYPKSLL